MRGVTLARDDIVNRIEHMNENDDLPDFIRRQWRIPVPTAGAGRKPTLDLDTIVAAAIRLADAGGLGAATLPKVGAELGVTAMSLYRHIGSKEDLVHLMADAASEAPPVASATEWRHGLRQWTLALWQLYLQRPWMPRVPVDRPPSGPNQIAWLDRGLATLGATPLTWSEKLRAVGLLSGYARQSVLLTHDLDSGRPAGQAQAAAEHDYSIAMGRLVTADRFPHVAAMVESSVFADSGEPTEVTARKDFTAGLDLVLDGLASRIDSPRADAGGPATMGSG